MASEQHVAPSRLPDDGEQVGDYKLVKRIGHGGFAVVWRAIDARDGTEVALKAFDPSRFQSASERERAAHRFRRGAAAMKQLGGCASIIAIREGPHEGAGLLWFSMELYESDLERELEKNRLSTGEREHIVDELLDAVSFAHGNDILHRDIKPSNVLIRRRDGERHAVLADFDLAFHEQALEGGQTTTSAVGSTRYMPPELLSADRKALPSLLRRKENDLYALSVVIFEIFGGVGAGLPAERSQGGFRQSLTSMPDEDPDARRDLLRERAAAVCSRGTSLDTTKRFRTIEQLERAWRRAPDGGLTGRMNKASVAISLISAVLVVDWAWYGSVTASFTLRSAGTLLGSIFSIAAGPLALGEVWRRFRDRAPGATSLLDRWVGGDVRRAIAVLVFAAFSCAWLMTDALRRMREIEVPAGAACSCAPAHCCPPQSGRVLEVAGSDDCGSIAVSCDRPGELRVRSLVAAVAVRREDHAPGVPGPSASPSKPTPAPASASSSRRTPSPWPIASVCGERCCGSSVEACVAMDGGRICPSGRSCAANDCGSQLPDGEWKLSLASVTLRTSAGQRDVFASDHPSANVCVRSRGSRDDACARLPPNDRIGGQSFDRVVRVHTRDGVIDPPLDVEVRGGRLRGRTDGYAPPRLLKSALCRGVTYRGPNAGPFTVAEPTAADIDVVDHVAFFLESP